ncbi:MAG: patatin-like phospholipase family protein [Salinarimonas sp.]|nr:patatin-like phospholipase family protein [Salinarimonas sp.]
MLLAISACAARDTGPINVFTPQVTQVSPHFINDFGDDGSLVVGVSFSGGGMRAAAFAHGVLSELDDAVIDEEPRRRSVTDSIRMVSGTSGGAVAAAYFGHRGPDGFHDFRERFLLQNIEANLRTSMVAPANLMRAWTGGVNDRSGFANWLDTNLFDGATYAQFNHDSAPAIWLTASDIYNGVPFIFTHDTFAALCSDLDQVRVADAVAASAAFPVAFAPIDVAANGPDCGYTKPQWLSRALDDPHASLRLKAHAKALGSYRDDDRLATVRLLDGGLTDNIGVTGFALERASADTPFGPLTPEQAVKLQKLLFIVTDAGKAPAPEWGMRERGPGLAELVPALAHTTITSSVRKGSDALALAVREWQADIIGFRCGLSQSEVNRLRGSTAGWDCRDVDITVELLSFRNFEPEMQQALNRVPTRLTLDGEQVDLVVEAGRRAVRENAGIRAAVERIRRNAGVLASPWPNS